MEILKDLFDKRIMAVLNLFIKNPEKEFYLSEISKLTKINISTTFRILNKLVEKNYIKANLMGKVKIFKLEKNEKTFSLQKFLYKDEKDPIQIFIDAVKNQARLNKIILESRTNNYAKFILVGNYLARERIEKIIQEIKKEKNINISFVEVNDSQFEGLRDLYNLTKKIVWEKKD